LISTEGPGFFYQKIVTVVSEPAADPETSAESLCMRDTSGEDHPVFRCSWNCPVAPGEAVRSGKALGEGGGWGVSQP
jgi:hypothetical protein